MGTPGAQGREGKVVQVYRKKWVIHVERITREKTNGAPPEVPVQATAVGSTRQPAVPLKSMQAAAAGPAQQPAGQPTAAGCGAAHLHHGSQQAAMAARADSSDSDASFISRHRDCCRQQLGRQGQAMLRAQKPWPSHLRDSRRRSSEHLLTRWYSSRTAHKSAGAAAAAARMGRAGRQGCAAARMRRQPPRTVC